MLQVFINSRSELVKGSYNTKYVTIPKAPPDDQNCLEQFPSDRKGILRRF